MARKRYLFPGIMPKMKLRVPALARASCLHMKDASNGTVLDSVELAGQACARS
jgi:hypothetical protein